MPCHPDPRSTEPAPPASDIPPVPAGRLASSLLLASDWFDGRLRARLAARGWPHLTQTRSKLFLHLAGGTTRPAALAERLDLSRQAVHKLLVGLEAEGLVARSPDPTDARAQTVHLTDRGRAFVRDAGEILRDLETELAAAVGADHLDVLRGALGRVVSVTGAGPAPESTRQPAAPGTPARADRSAQGRVGG